MRKSFQKVKILYCVTNTILIRSFNQTAEINGFISVASASAGLNIRSVQEVCESFFSCFRLSFIYPSRKCFFFYKQINLGHVCWKIFKTSGLIKSVCVLIQKSMRYKI